MFTFISLLLLVLLLKQKTSLLVLYLVRHLGPRARAKTPTPPPLLLPLISKVRGRADRNSYRISLLSVSNFATWLSNLTIVMFFTKYVYGLQLETQKLFCIFCSSKTWLKIFLRKKPVYSENYFVNIW